jgi:hypothetical protein
VHEGFADKKEGSAGVDELLFPEADSTGLICDTDGREIPSITRRKKTVQKKKSGTVCDTLGKVTAKTEAKAPKIQNKAASNPQVLILSLESAASGSNLTAASHVFFVI